MSNRHPVTIGSALLSHAVYILLVTVQLLSHILDWFGGSEVSMGNRMYPWAGLSMRWDFIGDSKMCQRLC